MNCSLLNIPYITILGISLLLIAGLAIFLIKRMNNQNHKFSSIVGVVTSMADELCRLKTLVTGGIVSSCIKVNTTNDTNVLAPSLVTVSDESEDEPETIDDSDDSDDEIMETVRILASDFGCKWIQGPRRGLYANRNCSILACRGSHIRTMDDDHTFPPYHFSILYDLVCANPATILTIGEVSPGQLADANTREPSVSYPGQLHPRGYSCAPGEINSYFGISCGGTIYPRGVFDDGYKNSEKFLFGSTYLEFGALLRYAGFDIRIARNTYFVHHAMPADLRRPDITTPALMFAILCHSFLYFPSIRNKLYTSFALARIWSSVVGKGVWQTYWKQSFSAFQERRRFVRCRLEND
jgi:glycosyltransferase involved in cell wall biosynthesis